MNRGYGKTHIWVERDRAGITQHAADELGEISFLEIKFGTYKKGDMFGTIESVKAVEDLIAPCDLKVVGINKTIEVSPEVLNTNAEETTIAVVEDVDMSGLMTKEEYLKWLGN